MPDSTAAKKPKKPYPDFPLFPHATKRWAKKIRGRLHYFGHWDDPDAALDKYLAQRDDLHAGRTPRTTADGLTVRDLCNRFCTVKQQAVDAGDITQETFADYFATAKLIVDSFGRNRLVDDLAADDFEALRAKLAKTRNPTTLGNEIQRIRVAFNYAYNAGLIDKPIRYGPTFKRPAKRILRAVRQKRGPRDFEADQLRQIIETAGMPMRAMILLGANCGFGNSDVARLPLSALDLKGGWVDFPRPKTAIERRCKLWPETVKALREWLKVRPEPKDDKHADLVFITKYGGVWVTGAGANNAVTKEFRKILNRLKIRRPGIGFYSLRRTFETQAGECCDQVATSFVMGHSDQSMAGIYRERISDDRLKDASDTVRRWLFPKPKKAGRRK